MRVSVFGPREFKGDQVEVISRFWKTFREKHTDVTYIHGGSKGIQKLLLDMETVQLRNSDVVVFRPWCALSKNVRYSVELMYLRNKQILDNSDIVLLFYLGNKENIETIREYCETHKINYLKITLED